MPFQNKRGSAVLPVALMLVFSLVTNRSVIAAEGALGDRQDGKGTVGPNKILTTKGGNPQRPPVDSATTAKKEQPKAPEKPRDEEKKNQETQKPAQSQKKPSPFPQSLDYSEDFDKEHKKEYFMGDGNCKCDGLKDLKSAVEETITYFKANRTCIAASGGPGGEPPYMAVNDYRHSTGCMYVIDLNGTCVKAVDAAYGIGSRKGGDEPQPDCGNGSLGTPSGFHVTAPHTGGGGRYDTTNSLLMQDLQGQGSAHRGILIHAGSCSGGACSWGCTGVSTSGETSDHTFEKLKEILRPGSLVYNYFGDKSCPGLIKGSCYSKGGSSGPVGTSPGNSNRHSQ